MKLPINISNFLVIRKENYLYVDKTRYIRTLEEVGRYLFFIRPRRFGKSLFISMLEHYYDIKRADEFRNLFDGLEIGANPTNLHNQFFILKLNFSGLDTTSQEGLRESFEARLLSSLIAFFNYYAEYFSDADKVISNLKESSYGCMEILYNEVAKTGKKIYLVIDEYDHFANDVIAMGDGQFYRDIIRASGFVRDFYETVKIGAESVVDRIFMTGIAPIMLDDLTSGFNITSNITMLETVNEMLGFTQDEVEGIMSSYQFASDTEALPAKLKQYYNGYLFNSNASSRVYNPNMLLHFFHQWQLTGRYPVQLIDENVKTDYGRLNRLISNDRNQETVEEILQKGQIVADIIGKFSFDMMYDDEYFVSLLFYMGLLTIDRLERTRLFLKIPNFVIKKIFWEYFERRLREKYQIKLNINTLRETIESLAYDGEINPYLDFITQHVLYLLSNRDLVNFEEKYIKILLFAYLNLGEVYKVSSEKEVEGGYVDIYLERDIRYPDVKYEWIWELKYLKKSERAQLEQVKTQGLAQLERYASSSQFADKTNLKKALLIFIGKDEYIVVEK